MPPRRPGRTEAQDPALLIPIYMKDEPHDGLFVGARLRAIQDVNRLQAGSYLQAL
jgi:hypothetical protein